MYSDTLTAYTTHAKANIYLKYTSLKTIVCENLITLGPTNLGHNKFGYHNFGYHNFSQTFCKFLVYNNFSLIF